MLFNTAHLSVASQVARTNTSWLHTSSFLYFFKGKGEKKEKEKKKRCSPSHSALLRAQTFIGMVCQHILVRCLTPTACVQRNDWLENKNNGNKQLIVEIINSTSSCELCRLSTSQLTELCWKITSYMKPWLWVETINYLWLKNPQVSLFSYFDFDFLPELLK